MELSYTLDKMRFCYHFYLDRDNIVQQAFIDDEKREIVINNSCYHVIRRSGLILDALEFSTKLNNATEKWCQNTNYHAESLKTLGDAFYSYGNYSQALIYDQRSLYIRTKLLGEEHPDTLSSLHSVGADYGNLGRYEESLEVDRKVYETRK